LTFKLIMKTKILVLAYAISPTRGSEYSVAWNYVTNMSKDNELVVLYGMSGNHMGDTSELEQYILKNPIPDVRFIAIHPNKTANLLNSLNKKGILVYSFYLAYTIWHKQVFNIAKILTSQEHFDLIHFLGPIGYREPGYLWKLPFPYIRGPIGGTTNISIKLIKSLPLAGKIKLGFRAIANDLQLNLKKRIRKSIDNTDVLLSATTENQIIIKKKFKINSVYIPENGINGIIKERIFNQFIQSPIILIWIGSLDDRKALITLLKALIKVENLDKIQLHIVGEGPLKQQLEDFAINNNLNQHIEWHGAVQREKVFELLSKSHLNIITSVSEGNPTTIWEAMSFGVPTISLDHCGMHDTICEKCGVKIPINSYEQVINDLAFQLDHLIINPLEIEKLSTGVIECAKKYTWEQRRVFFNRMYDLAIENWKNKTYIKT